MKKLQILLLLLGMMSISSAQTGFYPRASHLYYQWWYEDYLADTNHLQGLWDIGGGDARNDTTVGFAPVPTGYGLTELAMRFVIDSSMEVLGVSVPNLSTTNRGWYSALGLRDKHEFVRLYQCINDSLILLEDIEQTIDHLLVEGEECLSLPVDYRYQSSLYWYPDTCFIGSFNYWGMPSVEYYFDTPRMVYDTFFLSVTFNCLIEQNIHLSDTGYRYSWYVSNQMNYYGLGDGYTDIRPCKPRQWQYPSFAYKAKMRNLNTGDFVSEWYDTMWNVFMCIFPIINYESPLLKCDTATKLHLVNHYDNVYTFSWDVSGDAPTSWQFCFVPEGVDPDQGTIINCNTTTATINADPTRHYRAYVRSYCETYDRYSVWGEGVAFGANEGGDPETITLVDTYTAIAPNPAAEQLSIRSSFEMGRVEFYSLDGRKVKEVALSGRNAVVDIRDLSAGTYLVKIFTAAGSTTKKLVVR